MMAKDICAASPCELFFLSVFLEQTIHARHGLQLETKIMNLARARFPG
jgi:hypothetical protein